MSIRSLATVCAPAVALVALTGCATTDSNPGASDKQINAAIESQGAEARDAYEAALVDCQDGDAATCESLLLLGSADYLARGLWFHWVNEGDRPTDAQMADPEFVNALMSRHQPEGLTVDGQALLPGTTLTGYGWSDIEGSSDDGRIEACLLHETGAWVLIDTISMSPLDSGPDQGSGGAECEDGNAG